MEFEFSGDDDVWVYIDDVLVGDLGGIHDPAKLNINFCTGDVKVNDKSVGTLKSLFEAAGVSTGNFSDDTFAADSQHTLKFYYLERGAVASNMHLKFNLVTQPVSELLKIDQNGNPVQGAKFELYKADENYYVSGDPIATGTTDANGQLYFTNVNDHSVISFDKEADAGTTHFVLKEIGMPDGYHSSVTSYDGTMRLEYVRSKHEGGSSGGTLQSPTDTQDGFTVNRRWLNGGYVASKETLTAPSDLRAADGSSAIKPSTSKGTMFAIVYMKDDDGTWKALVGDAVNGYKTVGNGDLAGAIEAVRQQGGSTFALTTSGQYQVELNDLPGDARDYAYMMASDQMANAKYNVAVYYTTANTLDGATEDNTVRVDTDKFTRQFAAKLLVTNVQNRLFVQKVDEKGNPVSGATFSLYAADSVEDDGNGNYRVKDGAQPIDSVTTGSMTFPYSLEGAASFPLDSTNKRALTNGTYYLAETGAPDGYHANDTVTKVIVDNSGVYVDAGSEGDGVRSMSGPGSLLSALSQYGSGDSVDETLAKVAGTLESATETEDGLIWGEECTAQGITPADVNTNPMKMSYSPEVSSSGDVLKYVTSDGSLPIIYADTGINRMRIQQDGKPKKGDDLGTMRLNQLFTSATGVQYTDQRVARLEVTKQVTSDSGVTAPSTDTNGDDLTFEYTFRLPSNGLLGSAIYNTQEYDAQVFDASGDAVGDSFKLKDGDRHSIKAGETIRVYGLAAGDDFTVTETGKHEDLGFSLVSRKKGNEQQQGEGDAISGTIVETTSSGDISQNNRLTFTNNYTPIPATLTSGSFVATKTLKGREWSGDDKFTIRLNATLGTPMPDGAKTDEHNDHVYLDRDLTKGDLAEAGGDTTNPVGFGDITYGTPGTYTYTLNELIPYERADGMTYSGDEYRVTVVVADDGAGKLAVTSTKLERRVETAAGTVSYEQVEGNKCASFTNTYNKTEQKITFEALKALEDQSGSHALSDGEFTFQLEALGGFSDSEATWPKPKQDSYDLDASSVPMPQGADGSVATVTNNAPGLVLFPSVSYTVDNDASRCYVYRLSEEDTGKAGVTYDSGVYYFVVRVRQAGAGINVSREVYTEQGTSLSERPHFTNSYATTPTTSGPIMVQKTLEGRAWGDDETFDFTLTPANDETSSAITSGYVTGVTARETTSIAKPADASGSVASARASFDVQGPAGKLTFTRPGTYVFNVSENPGSAGNVTYDSHVSTVTFMVRDTHESDGSSDTPSSRLEVTVSYDNSTAAAPQDRSVTDAAAFTNLFRAKMTYAGINVTKVMYGSDLKGRDVSVHIKSVPLDGYEVNIPAVENLTCPDAVKGKSVSLSDANGSTSLLAGTFTQDQVGKTRAFIVSEDGSGTTKDGVSYDINNTGSALVTVSVGLDDSDNLYALTRVYKGASVDNLIAEKGDALAASDLDELDEPVQTLDTRDASDRDAHATVAFANRYYATLGYGAKAGLDVTKTLKRQGDATGDPKYSFLFLVKARDSYVETQTGFQLLTPAANAAQKLGIPTGEGQTFSTNEMGYGQTSVSLIPSGLSFTQDDAGNVYTYEVSEVKPEQVPAGYTYDETVYTVTIAVSDNADGTMSATTTVTKPGDDGTTVTVDQNTCTSISEDGSGKVSVPFTNTYEIDESGYATYTPQVKKAVAGADAIETFTFDLTAADDTTKSAIASGEVKADGLTQDGMSASTSGTIRKGHSQTVSFSQMTFTKVGTYRFEVNERVANGPAGWEYDTHTLKVSVEVFDNGGVLVARPTLSTDNGGNTFSNTYETSTTLGAQGGVDVKKTLTGRRLREGQFSFVAEAYEGDEGADAKLRALDDSQDGKVKVKNSEAENVSDDSASESTSSFSCTSILDDVGFESADAGKTFKFKVSEANEGDPGYTYDSHYYVVSVTPRLSEDGRALLLDVSAQRYGEDGNVAGDVITAVDKQGLECAFENTYAASGTLEDINATKTLTGRDMAAGEFKFNLALFKGDGSKVIVQQGTNEAASDGVAGGVDISSVTFTLGDSGDTSGSDANVVNLLKSAEQGLCTKVFNDDGTATYTFDCALEEDLDHMPDGVRPSTGVQPTRRFKVIVTDDGKGALTPVVYYSTTGGTTGSLDFYNTYEKVKTVSATSQPNVDIDGKLLSVGDTYSYSIKWINNATDADGHSCAANVSVTDVLPAGVEFVSATDGGTLGSDGKTVSWSLASREARASGSVHVVVRVTSKALATAVTDGSNVVAIENTATVKVGDRPSYSSDPVTNYVPTKSVTDGSGTSASSAQAGEELTYTVGWKNTTDTAADIVVTDVLPDNTELVEGSAGAGATYDAQTRKLTWRLGNKQSGEEGTVCFKVRVLPGAAGTTLLNSATVRPGDDPEVTTNQTSTRVGMGSLRITKTVVADGSLTAGKAGRFTFSINLKDAAGNALSGNYDCTGTYDGGASAEGLYVFNGKKLTLGDGDSLLVRGLPAGTTYTVCEDEATGYVTSSDNATGTIAENETSTAAFTNAYKAAGSLDGSASLRVTKSLVNEDGSARDWDEGDAFTFTLAPGDEATADAVKEGLITLPDNASGLVISRDAANHASEFGDITFKVAGTFTFDVAESRGADAKPSTAYDTSVKHVRVSVADKGNGQLAASVERSSDTLAFTNIYKTPKKVYRAGDDAKASIDGQTVSAGDKITYELAWVNNTGADARASVTDTLPQGVEFVSASDGGTPSADGTAVTWDLGQQPTDASGTVTLTVRVTGVSDEAGTDEIANSAKVTVGENSYDTNTVTVKAEKCSLEISKTVEGGDPNREFTFDVTLGNADGTPFAGTLGAKRYSEGQDTPEDVSVTFDAEGKAQLTLKAGQRIVVSRLSKSARYTVREQPAAGYTATVNGQDGSEATGVLDSGVTSVSFNNAYATDTYVAHTDNLFSKTLEGRDWADGESFSFTMTLTQGDASGVTYNGSATASKPASGKKATFGFGDMTFTRPGTYVFDVTEDGASAAGLEKDTHTATLTVTVRDDGLGHLVVDGAVPVIVSDGDFTNTYNSNLDYGVAGGLKLEKTLDGHAMAAGQFQFTLKAVDEDGAVAASESAALLGLPEAGKVFDSPASDDGVAAAVNLLPDDGLVLRQANANKTYAFELTETRGGGAGYTNDSQVHKVRIAVTDDGAGTLTATTTVDGTAYVYKTGDSDVENPAKVYLTNSYQASGEATIKAEKVLCGRDQVAGEFHFTVTDKQGSTVATGTNAADGAITFDKPLSYTQADVGTHAYTVTETGDLPSGVRGIVTRRDVKVSVTDNGDGTLRASVAYPDGADHLTFVNEYGADASASVSLNGTKSYDAPAGEGYATPDIEGKFAFTLTGADGAPMPSGSDGQAKTVRNTAGNVDFGEVAYTMADAGKTYEYTIAEAATDDSPKGVSVDGGTRVVRVSVTDNGDGTISATATDGDGNSLGTGSKFSFTNAYRVTQTSATIQGTKSLEGRELCDGEFTFELLEDGRQVAMTSNDAEGRFSFDLTYDKPGEHEYVVREVVPGETRGVSFDTHEAVAHVSVSDNGAGALVANVTYPGGDVSFKNTYAAEGTSARIVAVKRLEGATLADGQFTFQLSDAETGTVLQSATNAADGSVTFALGYGAADAGKTFTYKVSERNDGQAGVTYDGSSYTVKVEVTDDGEGHLSAKASTDDYLVFTNRYDAGGSGENPGGSSDVETPPAKQLPQTSDPLAGPGLEASIAVAGIAAIVVAALVRRRG